MQVNLLGKTALVTGSLSGIGLGIAKALAASGANIVLNGFASDDVISKIKADLKTKDNRVEFVYADLHKPQDAKNLVKKGIELFKGIDILVNNAGKQYTEKTVDFPQKTWEEIISLNLSASFYTSRYALPHMLQKNWGRIINISSVHGLVASVNKSAYVAAKHGLVGFTKVLALETAKTGITCNAICPGFVFTPLIESQIQDRVKNLGITYEQAQHQLLKDKVPSGRAGKPDDLAQFVLFLSSSSANEMTGGSYTMDGGWTAQ